MKPYEIVLVYENLTDHSQDMVWHEFDVDRPAPAVGDTMVLAPSGGLSQAFRVEHRTWEYMVSVNLETYVKLECTLVKL